MNVQKCDTLSAILTDTTTITSSITTTVTTAAVTTTTVSSTLAATTTEKQTLIDDKHEIEARNEYIKKIAYEIAEWFPLEGFTMLHGNTKDHLGEFDTLRPSLYS